MNRARYDAIQAKINIANETALSLGKEINNIQRQMTEYIVKEDPHRRGEGWLMSAKRALDFKKAERAHLLDEIDKMHRELKAARINMHNEMDALFLARCKEKITELLGKEEARAWCIATHAEIKAELEKQQEASTEENPSTQAGEAKENE